ncbi:hypothetical protein FYK55_28235 [Roseiconus nitratireducens]|uniref:Uncharacterized protein n=1 Tax=Roseiconus nitratireducens TaxID=2605748 RepID=A0A5M6CM50_9BACT|nr:hypothetical protein [Roseiconus nitratireducens]KAA5536086.1 hypothetical protein FYK55_28235 [Roseiconus nitratireducens]
MPYDPPLFSGGIRPGPDALRRVLTDLQAIHVDCDYELYDAENQLISQGRICKLASEDRNDG